MPAPRFHPVTRLIFCALGLGAVSVVLGFMLFFGSALTTAWTGRQPTEQLLDLATRFALPLTVLSYPASLLWIACCRTQFDKRSFASIGLRARRAFPDWARGALVGTLSIGLLWSILWLTGAVSVGGWSPEAFESGVARSLLALLGYAILFFSVGFFEETLFRGYALHNCYQWLGWVGAVAVQGAAFALVHLGNVANGDPAARMAALGALPSLFLIAVFFALCYRKTGSLWFPIGFHFAWNFCLGCVFSLPVSGIKTFRLLDVTENQANWLSGGAFGAEGSFFLIPILCALIYYIWRAPDHPQALLDLELLNRAEAEPAPAPVEPALDPEVEEPARENRYGTKFGTSQGFSADTLRELRELQEAREREQAEARDAVRRDALAQLESSQREAALQEARRREAAQIDYDAMIAADAAPEPLQAVSARAEPAPVEIANAPLPPSVTETPQVVAPEVVSPPNEAPQPVMPPIETPIPAPAPEAAPSASEPVKKKPPAPRW